MTTCDHSELVLLAETEDRVRCRHCHLTIKTEELGDGYCPECYESTGKRRYDFENAPEQGPAVTRYRCEKCHALIEAE